MLVSYLLLTQFTSPESVTYKYTYKTCTRFSGQGCYSSCTRSMTKDASTRHRDQEGRYLTVQMGFHQGFEHWTTTGSTYSQQTVARSSACFEQTKNDLCIGHYVVSERVYHSNRPLSIYEGITTVLMEWIFLCWGHWPGGRLLPAIDFSEHPRLKSLYLRGFTKSFSAAH